MPHLLHFSSFVSNIFRSNLYS